MSSPQFFLQGHKHYICQLFRLSLGLTVFSVSVFHYLEDKVVFHKYLFNLKKINPNSFVFGTQYNGRFAQWICNICRLCSNIGSITTFKCVFCWLSASDINHGLLCPLKSFQESGNLTEIFDLEKSTHYISLCRYYKFSCYHDYYVKYVKITYNIRPSLTSSIFV